MDGRYTHDLLPMPYTFAAAKATADKIREARDFLEVPICVENVSSYAEFHASEMTEWEFLTEVVERADCGILLDVNNIYVSSQESQFRSLRLSEQRPAPSRRPDSHRRALQVREIHSRYARSSGARSGLETVRARDQTGRRTATLLEWDDRIPTFDEVHHEALKATQFIDTARRRRRLRPVRARS